MIFPISIKFENDYLKKKKKNQNQNQNWEALVVLRNSGTLIIYNICVTEKIFASSG